jgi:tRNA modification GTPase
LSDTIFALSSGPPPAGVAVVRVSGPSARAAVEALTDSLPEPRRAVLATLRRNGEAIDRGLVLFFPGPRSFTGEDVVELHVHGGRAVIAAILSTLGELASFRPAEPGEFTRRAFVNRKLDLTEVEGLADLVAAETEAQRRQALRVAGGGLRHRAEDWRKRLVRARAWVEAELDFVDEADVPDKAGAHVMEDVAGIAREMRAVLDDEHRGERIRDGAEIVVLGPPNAGKSTLINALARREVAIVAPEPGTTRDLVEVRLDLGGYPVTVVDTAGLRETDGLVEREGIRRARARAAEADIVLWLSDVTAPVAPAPGEVAGRLLRVGTKADLVEDRSDRILLAERFDVAISIVDGSGLDILIDQLRRFVADEFRPRESDLIVRARHRAALTACADALDAARVNPAQPEIRAEELRRAGDALGRLAGRIDVEDVLDAVFREFCIGK